MDGDALALNLFDIVGRHESVFARSFTHVPPVVVGFVQEEENLNMSI